MSLSGEARLFFDIRVNLADGVAKETGKRRLTRIAIERISSLFELDAVEQSLDVARDRISRHDERRIERMDIFTRDRHLRVANEGRDRDLCEAEVIRDACKAVPQHVGGDVGEWRELVPVV
jgi:hypothetical protein